MLMQINRYQKLIKKFGVSVVKNRCSHSGLRALKLAVSQDGINGVN